MKDVLTTKPIQLNLQNFESPNALSCQYILTSPRSLKACKNAGIKPVELLHRSVSDIIEDFRIPTEVAHNIYEQHERDRQAKLKICQNIRNTIISNETKTVVTSCNSTNNYPETRRPLSSRKDLLDKENLQRASTSNYSKDLAAVISKEEIRTSKIQNATPTCKTETSTSSSPVSLYSVHNSTSPQLTSTKRSYNNSALKTLETNSNTSSSSISSLSTPRQCSSTLPLRKFESNSKYTNKSHTYRRSKKIRKQVKPSLKTCCEGFDDEYIYKLLPRSSCKYHPQIANYFNGRFLNSNVYKKSNAVKQKSINDTKHLSRTKSATKVKDTSDLKKDHLNQMQLSETSKKKVSKFSAKKENCVTKSPDCRHENVVSGKSAKVDKHSFKQKTPIQQGSLQNLATNQLKKNKQLCSSTSSLGAQPKIKEKTYRFLNIDKLKIPESDRRILETLALKKEQEKECEEYAHRAHLRWEADQQKRRELEAQKKKKWHQLVEAKRRLESEENVLRMEEIKANLRHSQKVLEENLLRRNEQAEKLKREVEERRILDAIEKKNFECKRRAIVDANLKHKEIESAIHLQKIQEELTDRLERAERAREKEMEITHRRVAHANMSEEMRHHENMCDVNEEKELILEQKRRELEKKDEMARQHHIEYLKHKEKHIHQNRVDREMRLEMAKEMQRELDRGLEAWQDQVLLLQCSAIERATVTANMNIQNKRMQVECENFQRQLDHSQRLQRVKEIEAMKKEITENTIKVKEQKIQQLHSQRERCLQEGRIQAHITADLREDLRRTLSPETFDRKVARADLGSRIESRPVTASPTMMMESHIHLG